MADYVCGVCKPCACENEILKSNAQVGCSHSISYLMSSMLFLEWVVEINSQLASKLIQFLVNVHIVSWEPEGHYCSSKMFRWEPEGGYCCTKSMAIVPFWFSTEHLWSSIAPFWLSADDIIHALVRVSCEIKFEACLHVLSYHFRALLILRIWSVWAV